MGPRRRQWYLIPSASPPSPEQLPQNADSLALSSLFTTPSLASVTGGGPKAQPTAREEISASSSPTRSKVGFVCLFFSICISCLMRCPCTFTAFMVSTELLSTRWWWETWDPLTKDPGFRKR